jgi:hypothetical protein
MSTRRSCSLAWALVPTLALLSGCGSEEKAAGGGSAGACTWSPTAVLASRSGMSFGDPTVAFSDGTIYVAWTRELPNGGPGTRAVEMVKLGPDLAELEEPVQVAGGEVLNNQTRSAIEPRLAGVPGGVGLAYTWLPETGLDSIVMLRVLTDQHTSTGATVAAEEDLFTRQVSLAAADDGSCLLSYQSGGSSAGTRVVAIASNGIPGGAAQALAPGAETSLASVGSDPVSGAFHAAYQRLESAATGEYLAWVELGRSSGGPVQRTTKLTDDHTVVRGTSVAGSTSGAIVGWCAVRGPAEVAEAVVVDATGSVLAAQALDGAPAVCKHVAVASRPGEYVVAVSGNGGDTTGSVTVHRFGLDGSPRSEGPMRIRSSTLATWNDEVSGVSVGPMTDGYAFAWREGPPEAKRVAAATLRCKD